MFYCENCGGYFAEPQRRRENYGLPGPWAQIFYACPLCRVDEEFREVSDEAL